MNGQGTDKYLDPTRGNTPTLERAHNSLPEEYIWTAGDISAQRPDRSKYPWNRPDLRIEPHLFRKHFVIDHVPDAATLYLAGPREARVYLNGRVVGNFTSNTDAPISFHVFHADVAHALKQGDNVVAIEAVRGRGVVSVDGSLAAQQLAYGEVIVAKIVPATFGVEAPAIVFTDSHWRSSAVRAERWEESTFDDRAWSAAVSLGPIEGNIDFFQWNLDAGMYGWPGYAGMSPWLRSYAVTPESISHIYAGHSQIRNISSLKEADPGQNLFTISLPAQPIDADAPTLLLDFGREIAGRLLVESACDCIATLSIAYGESEIEAMSTGLTSGQQGGNYLGTNFLEIPARGMARGPKSAFRYVRVSFLRGAPATAFRAIRVEGIYTPVQYIGSFESSDPILNRIWETGAYTAHLCMQDGIWDAPKRDRGMWAGDLDIEMRAILAAFRDPTLIQYTLDHLAESTSEGRYVNGIPGYSALWVTALEYLYQHSMDKRYLESQREHLIRILATMDESVDASGRFNNPRHRWLFVDWSPALYGFTREALVGTGMEYVRAYDSAAAIFAALGDAELRRKYLAQAKRVQTATVADSLDRSSGTFGPGLHLNALATLYLSHPAVNKAAIRRHILSHIKQDSPADPVISPYFNAYLIDAMAEAGLMHEALDWIREYWGGMLAEGATSFWEAYDLRWPKSNYHLSLEADGTSGYFVSLAHGWSSGPTAFLSEKILGVEPTLSGDTNRYLISPNLAGLEWARGRVPTPYGPIALSLAKNRPINIELPAGVVATVQVPLPSPSAKVYVNGTLATTLVRRPTAEGKSVVKLNQPGHYEISAR